MRTYEVTVSNLGSIHTGNNLAEARKHFGEAKKLSADNYGRWAGESVTLWKYGEPSLAFAGTIELEESAAYEAFMSEV